jgi:hypothetical protein
MKLVSWNCRGLGNKEKIESPRHLIKSEKTSILLLHEKKMKDTSILQERKYLCKKSMGKGVDSSIRDPYQEHLEDLNLLYILSMVIHTIFFSPSPITEKDLVT